MSPRNRERTDRSSGRPQVVVLGGGFAGLGATRELRDADVDVTLVDRHDYHTFQPLLYQVATDRHGAHIFPMRFTFASVSGRPRL